MVTDLDALSSLSSFRFSCTFVATSIAFLTVLIILSNDAFQGVGEGWEEMGKDGEVVHSSALVFKQASWL